MSKREIIRLVQLIEALKSKLSDGKSELEKKKCEKSSIEDNIKEIKNKIERNKEITERLKSDLPRLRNNLEKLRGKSTDNKVDTQLTIQRGCTRKAEDAISKCINDTIKARTEEKKLQGELVDANRSFSLTVVRILNLESDNNALHQKIKKEERSLKDEERKEQCPSSSLTSVSKKGRDRSGHFSTYN